LISGDVTVTGTASDPSPGQLASYKLEIGAGASPTVWQAISTGTASVNGAFLGDFSVNGLAAGVYVLRLVATDKAGNATTSMTPILVGLTVAPGDVTGDGKITVADATLALRAVVGLTTLTDAQVSAADVTQDGKLTVSDVTRILRTAVGL
jgi:hypothetical protein